MPVDEYKVTMLGHSKAGKTSYLAALYRALIVAAPERPYFLTTDHQTKIQLGNLYRKIADTAKPWPPPTEGNHTYELRILLHAAPDRDVDVARIRYLDYRGGDLWGQDPAAAELQTKLYESDAFLVAVDGQSVLNMLTSGAGSPAAEQLENELADYIEIIKDRHRPTNFVLTKWDIVEPHHGLEEVRSALLEIKYFRDYVATASSAQTQFRLVPVSAVGRGFSRLEDDGRTMAKVPGKVAAPQQVDIPLVSIMPARLRHILDDLVRRKKEKEERHPWLMKIFERGKTTDLGSLIPPKLEDARRFFSRYLPEYARHLTDERIERITRAAQQGQSLAMISVEQRLDGYWRDLDKIEDDRTMIDKAFEGFTLILQNFDEKNPAALLHGQVAQ